MLSLVSATAALAMLLINVESLGAKSNGNILFNLA